MERPFREVINAAGETLDKAESNDRFNQEYLDSFSLWLIGLAVAGFSLVNLNASKYAAIPGVNAEKVILLLFVISIICGILHRYFLFLFRKTYNVNLFFLRAALSDKTSMTVEPEDVSGVEDLEKIVRYLEEDFGLNYRHLLNDNVDDERKRVLLEELKKVYVDYGEWAKEDYRLGIKYLKDTFDKVYKYSERQYRQMEKNDGRTARNLDRIQAGLLVIAILSLISALSVLVILI